MGDLKKRNENQSDIFAIAKKKRIDPKRIEDVEYVVARLGNLIAYQRMKEAVNKHSKYVDKDGNASTSEKGLMITISKKTRAIFDDQHPKDLNKREIGRASCRERV